MYICDIGNETQLWNISCYELWNISCDGIRSLDVRWLLNGGKYEVRVGIYVYIYDIGSETQLWNISCYELWNISCDGIYHAMEFDLLDVRWLLNGGISGPCLENIYDIGNEAKLWNISCDGIYHAMKFGLLDI